MDETRQLGPEEAFLDDQIAHAEHKLTRIRNARAACHECLEAASLDEMIHAAEQEHELLVALRRQVMNGTVSLPALIIQRATAAHRQAVQQARRWRRGQPTPAAYWESECRHAFLIRLLGEYRAWTAGRPYYPETALSSNGRTPPTRASGTSRPAAPPSNATHLHPWFVAAPADAGHLENGEHEDRLDYLKSIQQRIYQALRAAGCPDRHIEIVVQNGGMVMAKGYAHSEEERATALNTMAALGCVCELIADIQVVDRATCPVCHSTASSAPPPT